MYRQWELVSDMNGDGFITISDVWAWVGWVFYYPGDIAIYSMNSIREGALLLNNYARFFETTPPQYGGWVSFFISLAAWGFLSLMVLGMMGLLLIAWVKKLSDRGNCG